VEGGLPLKTGNSRKGRLEGATVEHQLVKNLLKRVPNAIWAALILAVAAILATPQILDRLLPPTAPGPSNRPDCIEIEHPLEFSFVHFSVPIQGTLERELRGQHGTIKITTTPSPSSDSQIGRLVIENEQAYQLADIRGLEPGKRYVFERASRGCYLRVDTLSDPQLTELRMVPILLYIDDLPGAKCLLQNP